MNIHPTSIGGIPGLQLLGELDRSWVPSVRSEATRSIGRGEDCLFFDLTRLIFIDVAGAVLLYDLAEELYERGGWLGIVNPDANVLRILGLCGVTRSEGCRIYHSVGEATHAVCGVN